MATTPFVANTDLAWFRYLSGQAEDGRLDEANFWSPQSTRPMRAMAPGEPVFFRLKHLHSAIAGYGFFAHFCVLSLEDAWEFFEGKNGDPDYGRFLERIGGYRGVDLFDPSAPRKPLGCTILRDLRLWPERRWVPWGKAEGWAPNIVRGKTEREPRASRLLNEIVHDGQFEPPEFDGDFVPIQVDERRLVLARTARRAGQGAFRARLLDTYDRRCAITGERTEPVLEAAHIQPYLGPRSNHVQNGLLLTQEFHTLFDEGYLAITDDHRVIVSPRLYERWRNGRRYYEYDDRRLECLPEDGASLPSAAALEWHRENRFLD